MAKTHSVHAKKNPSFSTHLARKRDDPLARGVAPFQGNPTTECLKLCQNYLKRFPQCFKSPFSEFGAAIQSIYLIGCSRGTWGDNFFFLLPESCSHREGSDKTVDITQSSALHPPPPPTPRKLQGSFHLLKYDSQPNFGGNDRSFKSPKFYAISHITVNSYLDQQNSSALQFLRTLQTLHYFYFPNHLGNLFRKMSKIRSAPQKSEFEYSKILSSEKIFTEIIRCVSLPFAWVQSLFIKKQK